MKKFWLVAVMVCLVSACSPTPQPIEFGEDVCSHCKMTIVDRQHAAELVTKKGKVFKFDAIECMVDYLKDNDQQEYAFYLVHDYNNPEDWQNALTSHYLISNAIPSPMGAYLSAFKDEKQATKMRESKGGEVYDWEHLRTFLK
ncbi:MAG: nitrous oxide reductase accessory protein NosL [Lewinellaceae bacterium]|nr:nitrous oxide reductase accessory protein NosL [Saprospiraceae bacterium]MCB9339963.1 nitrous oxide reductase accessory protein NosL [Lewinellaceae bacterium]